MCGLSRLCPDCVRARRLVVLNIIHERTAKAFVSQRRADRGTRTVVHPAALQEEADPAEVL